jgi:hypothetical protein
MASKVTYAQLAPHVRLDPDLELQDIHMFEIHRSRIPTDLFQSIVTDMDAMTVQYGLPHVHRTNEARSRFFSPVRMLSLVILSRLKHLPWFMAHRFSTTL